MAQVIPEKINIVSIRLSHANISVTRGQEFLEKEKTFKLDMLARTGLSPEDDLYCKIDFTANFAVAEEMKDQSDFTASFSIEYIFMIENLTEFKVQDETAEHGFLLDNTLGATLMGIVYSTSRGIILTRTAGTLLDSIILPVINPAVLLET